MMKRILVLVLAVVFVLSGLCCAEADAYSDTVYTVRKAYYEAINAAGDGDVKYRELHEIAGEIQAALSAGNRSAVEKDCILVYHK